MSDSTASAPATATASGRLAWIDTAKGIAITLVVLFHSTLYLGLAGAVGPLTVLNPLLDTFRMPLFFFMSGVLGARAVALPYRGLFQRRLVLLLWLYVVWVIAQQLYMQAMPPISPGAAPDSWWHLIDFLVIPNPNLWFIYALPIFFTVAWLTRRLPPVIPLAVAALVAVGFGTGFLHTGTAWDKMGRYFVFFLLALLIGDWVRSVAPRATWWHALAVTAVYAVTVAAAVKFQLLHVPFVLLGLGILAVVVGIAVSVVLARWRGFGILARLGSRTLPIYLVHTFPMIAVAAVIVATGVVIPSVVAAVVPILLCAASIAIALAVYTPLRDVPGIFTVPVASWATSSTTPARRQPDAVR
ncbi:acyltransferase family protein [Leifsonia sp. YIM 134122]|uniref:Acyltransferase family protein n=1 Tax=Leifsonia stereocauli TaxID=3134136 RepID=A0ABU9W7J7_9MICO